MKRMIKTSIGISVMLATALVHAGKATTDSEDVSGQGPGGPVVSAGGATIIRTDQGIIAKLKMPTPAPGSYVYPEGNAFQPIVTEGFPEVFTGWIFIFNEPENCTDPCNGDDLMNPAARGGAYNFAGHVVGGRTLNFAGRVGIGDETFVGFPLDNPRGAEVHLAVAPHGELQPDIMPTQITTPIGNPTHWWTAIFLP